MPLGARKSTFNDSYSPRVEKPNQWERFAPSGAETPVEVAIDPVNNLVMSLGQTVDEVNYRSSIDMDDTGWSNVSLTVTGQGQSIAYNPTDDIWLVAGGVFNTSAFIQTSDDGGATWNPRTVPSSTGWIYCIRGNLAGEYVAVGQGGQLWTSTNAGVTWTLQTTPKAFDLFTCIYMENLGLWIAAGASDGADTYIITSTNLTTWTERAAPNTASYSEMYDINGICVVVGTFSTSLGMNWYQSVDGINWTQESDDDFVSPLSTLSIKFFAHRGKVLFGGGNPNPVDEGMLIGHTPSLRGNPGNGLWTPDIHSRALKAQELFGLSTCKQGIFVAPGTDDVINYGNQVSVSGLIFEKHTLQAPPGKDPTPWIDAGNLAVEPNKTNVNDSRRIFDMIWVDHLGLFIACGYWFPNAGTLRALILISQDGITWDEPDSYTASNNMQLRGIATNGSRVVIVGDDGAGNTAARYSDDGNNWTNNFPPSELMYSIDWNGTRFCAVGTGGKYIYSTNGSSWTEGDMPVVNINFTVYWDGTRFLAGGDYNAGDEGFMLFESADGITFTQITDISPTYWTTTDDWQDVVMAPNGQGQMVWTFVGKGGNSATTRDPTDETQYVERALDAGSGVWKGIRFGANRHMAWLFDKIVYREDPEADTWTVADISAINAGNQNSIEAMAYSPRLGRWALIYEDQFNATGRRGAAYLDAY